MRERPAAPSSPTSWAPTPPRTPPPPYPPRRAAAPPPGTRRRGPGHRAPLGPTGKVDRKALPAPERAPATEAATPRAEVLAAVFAASLGLPSAGADDDFFALGGDSVTALKALSRLRRTLGADLPARTLFDHPTPAALAAVLARESTGTAAVPGGEIPAAPRDGGPLPLSPGQERLWFLDAFAPGGVEYNTGLALRVAGGLDLTALRGALDGLAARHEPLRTTFAEDGQTVHPALPLPLRAVDADGEEELRQVLAAEQATPSTCAPGRPHASWWCGSPTRRRPCWS